MLKRSAGKRPKLTAADRLFWVFLCRVWNDWRSALNIVQPATVIAWHRKGFRLFWTWKIRHGRVGRPAVAREVRDLIRKMSRENPLWGAPHIDGELLKLGIEIGETSVAKHMVRHRQPPSQTWRTFLDNHIKNLVSVDFFTVPTIHFQVLYVFLVLAHDRRRVLHFNVSLRGARDRLHPARMPGPCDRVRGSLLASNPVFLLLPGASADPTAGAGIGGSHSPSWWTAPPLRTTRCLKVSGRYNSPTDSVILQGAVSVVALCLAIGIRRQLPSILDCRDSSARLLPPQKAGRWNLR